MEDVCADEATTILGQELKAWEKNFAAINDGRKPTRQDIKRDVAIAAKYKEYQGLRELAQHSQPANKKRKLEQSQLDPNPRRKSRSQITPSKSPARRNAGVEVPQDENASPTPELAFIGPTPQKDGHVLGLLDLLPGSATPSKTRVQVSPHAPAEREALGGFDRNKIVSTPTKGFTAKTTSGGKNIEEMSATPLRRLRTPKSSEGKRFLLDKFVTPSKRRRHDEDRTPQSLKISNPHSTTPAFLRRATAPLPSIHEDQQEDTNINTTVRPGFKRKRLTRSLSSMIAEIRQAEEERLDEEMLLFREMESSKPSERENLLSRNEVQEAITASVALSQTQALGPDGSELPPVSIDGHDPEQQLAHPRSWKKKGPKRKTRKVAIKPSTLTKATPAPALNVDSDSEIGQENGTRNETRGHDDVDELDHSTPAPPPHPSSLKIASESVEPSQNVAKEAKDPAYKQQGNIVRKTARKVSAAAHANFRRLKIRSSKGAKAASAANAGRKGTGGWGRRR